MDGIFEFLPIIVIVLIGILRSLAGGKQDEKQQKQQRPNVPRPRPTGTPSGGQTRSNQKTTSYGNEKTTQPTYQTNPSNVYAEQQKQQMEELKKRVQTSTTTSKVDNDVTAINDITEQDMSIGPSIQDAIKHQDTNKLSEKQEAFKKDVKSGLSYKGLVRGVIMSEVLGPPRARKPYRSVIQERKRYTR